MVTALHSPSPRRGFTLIELLVALAVIALLLSVVTPRYFSGVTRAEEAVLRGNLHAIRDALDQYHADTGRYPDSLADLVTKRYMRAIPKDPITNSTETWVLVPPADTGEGLIFDVRSGANSAGHDGQAYDTW